MSNFENPQNQRPGKGLEQAHCEAMRSTRGAKGDEEDGAIAELRKARFFAPAKNDPRK